MDRLGSEKSQSKRGLRRPHHIAEFSTHGPPVLWGVQRVPYLWGNRKGGRLGGGKEDQGLAAVKARRPGARAPWQAPQEEEVSAHSGRSLRPCELVTLILQACWSLFMQGAAVTVSVFSP